VKKRIKRKNTVIYKRDILFNSNYTMSNEQIVPPVQDTSFSSNVLKVPKEVFMLVYSTTLLWLSKKRNLLKDKMHPP